MALQLRATTTPAPISFSPSQAFEGNDGPWSTFVIRVGTPAQIFRVLISTTSEETWIPVPEGCLSTDPSNCGALRGVEQFQNLPSSGFQVNSVGKHVSALIVIADKGWIVFDLGSDQSL